MVIIAIKVIFVEIKNVKRDKAINKIATPREMGLKCKGKVKKAKIKINKEVIII